MNENNLSNDNIKDKNKTLIILTVVITLIIILGGLCFFDPLNIFSNNKTNNQNSETDEAKYASHILANKTEVISKTMPKIKYKIDSNGKLKISEVDDSITVSATNFDKELVSIGLFEEGLNAMDFSLLALTKEGELYIIYSKIPYYGSDSDNIEGTKMDKLYNQLDKLVTYPEGMTTIEIEPLKVESDVKVKAFTDLYHTLGERTGIETGIYVLLENGEIRLIEKNNTAKIGERYTGKTINDSEKIDDLAS